MKYVFASMLMFSTICSAVPCNSEQHNAFDFWLGYWQVFKPDGSLAGYNTITKRHNNCVLHESYSTASGFSGESLNIYHSSRGVWHQTWVDNTGALLVLEGNYTDGAMVLTGSSVSTDGNPVLHKISWQLNNDGSVRQHWQTQTADGQWHSTFEGLYRKVQQAMPGQ